MIGASAAPSGTFSPHGDDASNTKKSAPVSRTVRSTSESTSWPDAGANAVDAGAVRPRGADVRTSASDAARWRRFTARSYTAAMSDTARGQVIASAAEVYEDLYVPALFQEWAPRMVDAARVVAGQRVVDVACGTGVLARALAERVGANGHVAGLDINDGMLAVARRRAPAIAWHRGATE